MFLKGAQTLWIISFCLMYFYNTPNSCAQQGRGLEVVYGLGVFEGFFMGLEYNASSNHSFGLTPGILYHGSKRWSDHMNIYHRINLGPELNFKYKRRFLIKYGFTAVDDLSNISRIKVLIFSISGGVQWQFNKRSGMLIDIGVMKTFLYDEKIINTPPPLYNIINPFEMDPFPTFRITFYTGW